MDCIFLDTSVFINQNYLNSTIIKEFFHLSSVGYLRLVTTQITLKEIKSNYSKNVGSAKVAYNKGKKDYEKVLRSIHSKPANLPEFNEEYFSNLFNTELNSLLRNASCIILDYRDVNVEKIFEQYFTTTAPFGEGNKKSEFPDAFVLNILEEWAVSQRQICYIFSSDNDMLKYEHANLKISNDFKGYLNERVREIENYKSRIAFMESLYKESEGVWSGIILNWINSQLEDTETYFDYVNGNEVYDIIDTEAKIIKDDYSLISVDGDNIIIEITVTVHCAATLLLDDQNTMYKDYDTKEFHYVNTIWHSLNEDVEINATFKVYLKSEDDYSDDFELIEINNGNNIEFDTEVW